MKNSIVVFVITLLLAGVTISGFGQEKKLTAAERAAIEGHGDSYTDIDPRDFIKDQKVLDNIEEWQDLKFGFMVTWGVYSQWEVTPSWLLCAETNRVRERMRTLAWKESGENIEKFREMHWDLNKTFNPVKFDAAQWAHLAKDAGMKYFVFVTMHHDGFNMFDSRFTDYKITGEDCPYHTNKNADVTKKLFNSFRKKGFKIGAYYSKPSWHNQNFWDKSDPIPTRNANYDVVTNPAKWNKYVQFTHNQIDQLLSDYGDIDILWLDGGWVNPDNKNQDIRMSEIASKGREKQARKDHPSRCTESCWIPSWNQAG